MSNADQAEFWAGQVSWVTYQRQMDLTLAPVLDMLLERADLQAGESVLDLGCGTGDSVLAAAQRVGPGGRVTGLDISPTLLDLARQRVKGHMGARIDLIAADAQIHPFANQSDVMISRFGVMFFADTAAAFRNIATGLTPGARLVVATWGPAPQNPWFMEAAAAARAHLGDPPKSDRTLPGPFAFEDPARILPQLRQAGLDHVAVEEVPVELAAGALEDAATVSSHLGPANSVLRHFEGTEQDRAIVRENIAASFAKYQTKNGLRIPALINLYTATCP